jgi:hypothetical protein
MSTQQRPIFPCEIYAKELMPEDDDFVPVVDKMPTLSPMFNLKQFYLIGGENGRLSATAKAFIGGRDICAEAILLNANLGLSDAKIFMDRQDDIREKLQEIKGGNIIFPATVFRWNDSGGGAFHFPCIKVEADIRLKLHWENLNSNFSSRVCLHGGGNFFLACIG